MRKHLLRVRRIVVVVCIAVVSQTGIAATHFVATSGNDVSGNGGENRPWKTIGQGIKKMAGGDTLVVRSGRYLGKANFIGAVPSGTSSQFTTIMADAPMEVRIVNSYAERLDYRDNLLNIQGQYVKIDGIIFDLVNSLYPPHIGVVSGNHVKILRSIFRRAGIEDNYGGLLVLYGSNNLVEDVAGVGACRYCFEQGAPDAVTKFNIWRRIVGRFDYSGSPQPKRTITTYGNDSGTGVSDHLYQNVISLDGNDVDRGRTSAEPKYSAIGIGKQSTNVSFQGAIVLNENATYAGIFASVKGTGNKVTNSIVWDMSGPPTVVGIRGDNADTRVDHVTIGGRSLAAYYWLQFKTVVPPNSSLGTSHLNLLANSPGATVMKRYGVTGTMWGEPGFDQLTNENLWPWLYEEKIKEVFREANDPPKGYLPIVNNTKRGFAADGNGRYGGAITLTSYIWEYLGNPCPREICQLVPVK